MFLQEMEVLTCQGIRECVAQMCQFLYKYTKRKSLDMGPILLKNP